MNGCLIVTLLLLPEALTQDATDSCNTALGLSSGDVPDDSMTGPGSNPSAGRLGNVDGAWCFSNDSIASQGAALRLDLGRKRFVAGFASQGPPEGVRPKAYNHLVAFSAAHSLDGTTWEEFNEGLLFFNVDKNDTSDVVIYHESSAVELTRYVKINVTMQISGEATTCLRFEIYGCDTDILPSTGISASTTPKGKIEVIWQIPSVETTLGEAKARTPGVMRPGGYAILYRPLKAEDFASVATGERRVSLEDVRLGATYLVRLRCLFRDVAVDCGSTQVEAYPPCPNNFTGGNEYHCFLHLGSVSSLQEARTKCLDTAFDHQLGSLGYLVDEDEKKFVIDRILPKDTTSEFWLVGEACQEDEECCTAIKVEGDTLKEVPCPGKELTAALCLRDHKGEGARLRVSSVSASEDGSSAHIVWRYEGAGWKTDELQVKMWRGEDSQVNSFSTLSQTLQLKTEVGEMYSFLLRPAPNIKTEEFVYRFVVIDFEEGTPRYGAVLTPVPMSIYIIWSGSLRVTWDEASALSVSGKAWPADKYSISHRTTSPEAPPISVEVEGEREFQLTPIAMSASYNFQMSCFFAGVFRPCGEISITTDPPDLVLYKPSKVYVIYEVIPDKPKSWSGAEDDCQQRKGHLTSLLDEAEAKALFKMLPSKDAKIWTGAKLGKKGTGFWTDGEKITDLPMAKNSGVTSSSESCCRAIQEAGQLKLAGGHCEDRHPYICKYTVKEMMSVPGQLQAMDIAWNTFRLSWAKPGKRWMPTFYNVQACLKESCIVRKQLKDKWTLKLEDLVQFQVYEVQVEAVLQPVDVKTFSQTAVMTHPKSPVQVNVSPKGKGSVSCPVLTARGSPDAKVTATLHQMQTTFLQATGGVKDLPLTGLVPEETYRLVVKQDGGDWTHELTFEAVPTCMGRDSRRGSNCYGLVEEAKSFEEARKACTEATERKAPPLDFWMPKSEEDLKNIASDLGIYSDSWIKKPADGSLPKIGSDSSCSSGGDATCCFYELSASTVTCSACCDRKLPFVCSYQIKDAYLGEVSGLLPSFVGNRSLSVEWSAPDDVSWQVDRFEVEWSDVEGSVGSGKEVVAGITEKKIEGLEYGTEYEVQVTPIGAKKVKGKASKVLITTLDPRQGLAVQIDSDGSARVYSPRMMEKGRGGDPVVVKLYRTDGSKALVATYDGQVSKVDVTTELQVGQTYRVEMESKGAERPFQFDTEFVAYPSCQEHQIQDGLVCLWPSEQTKSWTEAYEVCRGESGELLDYKTQEELTQRVKAQLTSHMQDRFWLDMGAEGTAALRDADSSNCPSGQESEVMCCTYEVSETGELDNLKCSCCDEPRPFACKKNTNLHLGSIGSMVVEDVTPSSVTLGWTLASGSRWGQPSYLVTWWEGGRRRKRSQSITEGRLVVQSPPASVTDLKPGTQYKIAVAPYTEAAKTSGEAKEISATTSEDIDMASLVTGDGCTMIILKMSCCITVILGSSYTIFVFIAARMFYLDCLAQIFAEIATLGAYVCILVSSAQSYANSTECLMADRTLCVAVSVLIQFFFQVIYMFFFLEALVLCTTLKDYLPQCCAFRSHLAMAVCGFGFPAIMMIVLAAVASDGFSDGDDNCWLDLEGTAMLPSVIPVIVLASVSCLLLLSVFDAKEGLPSEQRGRYYLKTRWGCFVVLVWTSVCYACGLIGVNQRDPVLNYVFVGFSMSLGIIMPIVRMRCDDEVMEQLKRGLFSSLKDDLGAIRVSPAPDPLLEMSEFERRKYKQTQLLDDISREDESVYHR